MKKQLLFISLLCLILFSSCETYIQLYHLESKTVKKENDTFIFENDTLKITYSFWGNRGVLAFEIYNKLAKPIYIDWKKSSFIYKDQKLNFWVETETETSSGVYKNYLYTGTSTYGYNKLINTGTYLSSTKKEKPERITFIPPKSGYTRSQFHIFKPEGVKLPTTIEQKDFKNLEISAPLLSSAPSIGVFPYTNMYQDTTAAIDLFRNFLTFSLTEDITNEFYIDNSFYLKSIYEFNSYDFPTVVGSGLGTNDKFYIEIPEEQSIKYRK